MEYFGRDDSCCGLGRREIGVVVGEVVLVEGEVGEGVDGIDEEILDDIFVVGLDWIKGKVEGGGGVVVVGREFMIGKGFDVGDVVVDFGFDFRGERGG